MEVADSLHVNGGISPLQLALLISLPVSSFGWSICQGIVFIHTLQLDNYHYAGEKGQRQSMDSSGPLGQKPELQQPLQVQIPDQYP